MMQMQPQKSAQLGSVRIVDSSNFPAAAQIAMAHVTLKPGGLRELHWHPNANEWQYFIQGGGRMTLFNNGSAARTADFKAGDYRLRAANDGPLYREHRQYRFCFSSKCSRRRVIRTSRSTIGLHTSRRSW
jgi:hypothetical protein